MLGLQRVCTISQENDEYYMILLSVIEGLAFVFLFSGLSGYLSELGYGQPWYAVIILLLAFVPRALLSGEKIRIELDMIFLFVAALGYLIGFWLEIYLIQGLGLYLIPILYFISHLLLRFHMGDSNREKISRYVFYSMTLQIFALFFIPFLEFNSPEEMNAGIRFAGLYRNSNLAAFSLIGHLLCIYILNRRLFKILIAPAWIAVLFTFSRSGNLFFIILALLAFVTQRSEQHKKVFSAKVINTIFVVLISGLVLLFSIPLKDKLAFDRLDPTRQLERLATDSSRITIIDKYFGFIGESPILGNGVRNGAERTLRAHNTVLNMWDEVGFLPPLCFLAFIILQFIKSPLNYYIVCFPIFTLFYSFFINNLLFAPTFWLAFSVYSSGVRNRYL